MDSEERLRQEVNEARKSLADSAWTEGISAKDVSEFRDVLEREIFMTSLHGKRRFVNDAVLLMIESATIHRPDVRLLHERMTDSEFKDIYAFHHFVAELLPTYPADSAGISRIGVMQGYTGWAACLVGLWTAREPDTTPLLRKLPTALAAWKLMPPSLSAREAERNRQFLMSAVRSMSIDEYLADRVVTIIVQQSTTPVNKEIQSLVRQIATHHLRHLTTLHRATEHVLKLCGLPASSRRFFMTFITHETYRGLLIGYRVGERDKGQGVPRHMRH